MKVSLSARLRACLMAACAMLTGADASAQGAAPVPVETLFAKPSYRQLVLSPNQKLMAALAPADGRLNILVIDLEKRTGTRVTGLKEADVTTVMWANDHRLIYNTGDARGLETRSDGGLFAIDVDGNYERKLVSPFRGFVARFSFVMGRVKGSEDEVYVSANDSSEDSLSVYRMNVVSGKKTQINEGSPGRVIRWVLDRNHVPRAALSRDEQKKTWWFSYLDGKEWKTAARWDERLENVVIPKAFDPADPDSMFVASNAGRDTLAYFRFNLKTGQLGELIFGDDRYDVESFHLIGGPLGEGGSLVFAGTEEESTKLIGLTYLADKPRKVWFDAPAAKLQASLDAALPGATNQFNVSQRRSLVYSASDVDPGSWYLFDRETLKLEETGVRSRPGIDPGRMLSTQPVQWVARDGVRIDGYLTLPKSYRPGNPVPLVLHPHGGPWAKDNWQFNPEVQFMASRGYAVLQPNFRGSTGYGAQHLRLSYKHWGDTMIDDMIDGVEWAVKQGYADRAKLGVYGASYGGYATLMALVRKPDMFNWAVNYVGVTDMAVHQDTQPAQLHGQFAELAKVINGDQSADKALFEAQSPARHVGLIRAPVFHAYGGEDRNVDYANGRLIRAAFDKAGKPYEWMFVADEAHGYHQDKNVFEFYRRFEKFMADHATAAH